MLPYINEWQLDETDLHEGVPSLDRIVASDRIQQASAYVPDPSQFLLTLERRPDGWHALFIAGYITEHRESEVATTVQEPL